MPEPYGWCKKHRRVVCYDDYCEDFEFKLPEVCGNCEHYDPYAGVCELTSEEFPEDDPGCEDFEPSYDFLMCLYCAHYEPPEARTKPDGGSPDDIGREPSEYIVHLGEDNLTESFKQLYKLLQHAKRVLGEIEARLRELESELRTFGVLMPDGGGRGATPVAPEELLKAHGLAGYIVVYDLPVGTPRWKLRRELAKLTEAGIAWHYIQKSVIWCPTEGDAGAVAQAILSIADGPSKVEVFAVARMSWHDLVKAAEERKRRLLARKLRQELNMTVSPEDLASLSIADIDELLRMKGEKLARAVEALGLARGQGATPVAPRAPMSPLEAWAKMDEEVARPRSATGVAPDKPEMTPGQAGQEHAGHGAGVCSRVCAGDQRPSNSQ